MSEPPTRNDDKTQPIRAGKEFTMTARVRFSTARQVFETFPSAARHVEIAPSDEAPLEFGRKLLARGRRFDVIAFGAFLLPRREAIWWGCQCLRALNSGGADAGLDVAEAWVRDPVDETRREALARWRIGDRRLPGTWLAMAAGHSGGSISRDGAMPRTPPAHATAVGVKTAVVLALARAPARFQSRAQTACAEAWLRFAEGGDAKVRLPAV